MTKVRRIAVDVMGGDHGPHVTVSAALKALRRHPDLHLVLVGPQQEITPSLDSLPPALRARASVLHTDDVISNHDRPDRILRSSPNSSMFIAIDQVKQGQADACVSAGNTGALLMAGRHLLKTIPGIDKPAIMAMIPVTRAGGYSYLLDVGANVRNSARELYQFACMGAVLASSLSGRKPARVALLNIGEESIKGTPVIQEAAGLLADNPDFEYLGYIEGNQLFSGHADVIVCDGFTGNITIKTSAGAVKALQALMRRSIARRWYYKTFSWILKPLLRDLRREIDPARYNGATLVGLQGIIVKSHGNANEQGFLKAIEHALRQINDNVPALIAGKMV